MRTFMWPAEDGWPYPDTLGEVADIDAEVDTDLLSLAVPSSQLLAGLDPLERQVIAASYGLEGQRERSLGELGDELGLPRDRLADALGSALGKLRARLA